MRLIHLSLAHFRNFDELDLAIPSGTTVLVGNNAQGKTSLLEAVYYLAGATSPHASSARQLINFERLQDERPFTRIVADIESHGEPQQVEIRILLESVGAAGRKRTRKDIIINQQKRRVSDLSGVFNAVLFLPRDMDTIEGSPGIRRRYLDAALSQGDPSYAAASSEYSKVLTRRNALLRQLNERGGDPRQMQFWDDKLAEQAYSITRQRAQMLMEIECLAAGFHHQLTRKQEHLLLPYQPSFAPWERPNTPHQPQENEALLEWMPERNAYLTAFKQALLQRRREELARKTTVVGPHRDDFGFLSNGMDLTQYGSRGQNRTAMLSMKLAEVEWLQQKTGEWPVLLLDEVLAELDVHRRQDLLERINDAKQVLLTSADLDMFDDVFREKAAIWSLVEGRVHPA